MAAAQVGRHSESRASYGHAMIVDPWGAVLAQCSDAHSPCIAVAEIDLDWQADLRLRMPLAAHKRPDVYASVPRIVRAGPGWGDDGGLAAAAAGEAASEVKAVSGPGPAGVAASQHHDDDATASAPKDDGRAKAP